MRTTDTKTCAGKRTFLINPSSSCDFLRDAKRRSRRRAALLGDSLRDAEQILKCKISPHSN